MTNRRDEGQDEPIIEPDLPIVDAHHHLFHRPPVRYLLDEFLRDVGAGHKIVASVYVESQAMVRQDGPEVLRPIGEVEFANGVAAVSASGGYGLCRVAAAIVGYADLRHGDRVAELLDRSLATAPDRFRGIRQITIEDPRGIAYRYLTKRPPEGILTHPEFRAGFRHLSARGLSFDAVVLHHQIPELTALAGAFPDATIILNHLGLALALDTDSEGRKDVWRAWCDSMRDLARHENVACKIGGLGMPFWGFGFETYPGPLGYAQLAAAWRPYIETAIELFGVDRCMMESNYPADSRSCGYVPLWNALKHCVSDFSGEEKSALFRDTAARTYRIDLSGRLAS